MIINPYKAELNEPLNDNDFPRSKIEVLTPENLYGCKIVPHFFSEKVNSFENSISRLLPFLPKKFENFIQIHCLEKDKKNFKYGDIVAQPDGVFYVDSFSYYISLEYKSLSSSRMQTHNKNKWKTQIRLKDILQCVIGGLQVSAIENSACVCVLRYVNSIYIIHPSQELCKFILEQAPKAKVFKNEGQYIRSSLLAETIENDVKRKFSLVVDDTKGQDKHNSMLRY